MQGDQLLLPWGVCGGNHSTSGQKDLCCEWGLKSEEAEKNGTGRVRKSSCDRYAGVQKTRLVSLV